MRYTLWPARFQWKNKERKLYESHHSPMNLYLTTVSFNVYISGEVFYCPFLRLSVLNPNPWMAVFWSNSYYCLVGASRRDPWAGWRGQRLAQWRDSQGSGVGRLLECCLCLILFGLFTLKEWDKGVVVELSLFYRCLFPRLSKL